MTGAIRPRWEWALVDEAGALLDPALSPVFTTQYDAEEWLGERWRSLAAGGAVEARLLHDGAPATAPLPLRAP
ncbi:hypothetical protein [Xylanimonas ulmi]|uniref:Uncharacterized protein n=1 Tax=Xylanimonas ulmi TaxID=228973 RepID=A0A4Q7M3G0_9MICO|nr:hypothetical protein [Xylanibacterium ulmi]RZS60479.1 hypothetical protein EV386_0737 [Xylanibacterium ulmi]